MLLIGLIPEASNAVLSHAGDSFVVTPLTSLAPKNGHNSVSTLTSMLLPGIPFSLISGKLTSLFKTAATS